MANNVKRGLEMTKKKRAGTKATKRKATKKKVKRKAKRKATSGFPHPHPDPPLQLSEPWIPS